MSEESLGINLSQKLRAVWRMALALASLAIVPLILLYVFGFSAKTTKEYACALDIVARDEQIIAIIGEPVTPGLFAWTTYFESEGGLRQGRFSTKLMGPDGKGTLIVEFYRAPIGDSFGLWFKTGGQELEIYYGDYPCH
jgi:hypothetical protein